jgi:hypothetical protein
MRAAVQLEQPWRSDLLRYAVPVERGRDKKHIVEEGAAANLNEVHQEPVPQRH